jgi:hypothetical protein
LSLDPSLYRFCIPWILGSKYGFQTILKTSQNNPRYLASKQKVVLSFKSLNERNQTKKTRLEKTVANAGVA